MRCVFFISSEVFFTCPRRHYREAYTLARTNANSAPKITNAGLPKSLGDLLASTKLPNGVQYLEMVEKYTNRHLTYTGDRLDAFTALIDFSLPIRVSKKESEISRCGAPLEFVYYSLFWSGIGLPHSHRGLEFDTRRRRVFPSWSWLGWECAVSWRSKFIAGRPPPIKFEILDSQNLVGMPCRSSRIWQPWPFTPT